LDWHSTVHELGYGLIPSVFTEDEVVALLQRLASDHLPRTRAGVRHAMRSTTVTGIARDSRMMEIARLILGAGAIAFRATLFEKLPDSNWLVAWHQDTALPLRERRETAGWGPWSVKDGVNYAHAPAAALEKVVALRMHLDRQRTPARLAGNPHPRSADRRQRTPSVECLMPQGGRSGHEAAGDSRIIEINGGEYAESASLANGLELATA
jgi:hypothetical protein